MISFNVPPVVGNELKYIEQAIGNHKSVEMVSLPKNVLHGWKRNRNCKSIIDDILYTCNRDGALLADIQPGDEVVMPSFTFVSTADAFVLRGAKVKFVGIRPDTMNIDETLIEDAITDKTKAIVPVHYAGVGCEMDTIMDIARKHHLLVIEDAAQGVNEQL